MDDPIRKAAEAMCKAGIVTILDAPLVEGYLREAVRPLVEAARKADELPWKTWHHADLIVRVNGEDRRYEADWIKGLARAYDSYRQDD